MEGILLICLNCKLSFCVCRTCWKCQRYCSKSCSEKARQRNRCKDQRKYSQTIKGKESQTLRNHRYRCKKIVTDQTTKEKQEELIFIQSTRFCVCCGTSITHMHRAIAPYFSFRRINDCWNRTPS